MSKIPKCDEIITMFREGSAEDRVAFVQNCPPSSMRDSVLTLVGSENKTMQVLSLSTLVQAYGFGQNTALGSEIAKACHTLCQEILAEQDPDGPLKLYTVSGVASTGIGALNLQGRYEEAIAFADEVIPFYEQRGEWTNLPVIYTGKIEALLQLNRIDEAKQLVEDQVKRESMSPDLPRLKQRIEEITCDPREIPSDNSSVKPSSDLASAKERSADLRRLADMIGNKLTQAEGLQPEEMNEWQAKKIIRDSTSIFLDEIAGRDPDRLQQSLGSLAQVREWTRDHGTETDDNDALWGIYLCNKRLDRFSDAADTLKILRDNVERMRASIRDPLERGGFSNKWPYLFPALCDMLSKADRTDELLDAMDGAKGRVVADLLTQRQEQPISDRDVTVPKTAIPELMQSVGAHYVSFFVDEEYTLAVLVAKDGSLHQSGQIPVGKSEIRHATRFSNPKLWGKPNPDDPLGPDVPDISQSLSPLISWIERHLKSGLIAQGDHIVYSPDEHLHNVPLHYIKLQGEPLVSHISISRTHGSHLLALALEDKPLVPKSYKSIEVPTQEDVSDEDMAAYFRAIPDWLKEKISGASLSREQAQVSALSERDLKNQVIHFATHGIFPEEGAQERDPNPYHSSGVVLAKPNKLPSYNDIVGATEEDLLLSPKRILDLKLDFSGSHVTLQSCVSGLAKEGVGGDALGMDWALTQAGAESLLTSHWDVSAALSVEFFKRFYEHWIVLGSSRAAAWRESILELMNSKSPLSDPFSWAAFSLSGDWR